MVDRDSRHGDYDRSRPWDLGSRPADDDQARRQRPAGSGPGRERGFGEDRGFGEPGGDRGQWADAHGGPDQSSYSGAGRAARSGQAYGQMGDHWGAEWDDRDDGGDRGRGGGRQTEQRRFGQSGQAGFGESDYAHGLSQSAGYGPTALGSSRVGYSAQGANPAGYGGYGQEGYGGGATSMGRGQRRPGAYGRQYGDAYGQGDRGGTPGQGYGHGGSGGDGPRGGGSAPGFGQGGAYQAGYGGQSDRQMREEHRGEHRGGHDRDGDRDRDMGRGGQGVGTYGQHDYGAGARRSEFRDEQRYGGGMHQNQTGSEGYTGFSGYAGPANPLDRDDDHEPDYKHWKSSRLSDLDREHHEKRSTQEKEWDDHYKAFREHKRTRFGNEFEDWRKQRQAQGATPGESAGGGDFRTVSAGSGTNIGAGASATDRDDERSKSISSPAGERTDMTGVGASPETTAAGGGATGTAPGGGAGLRGAGAAGGSSATMASGSGSAGADQTNTGASAQGVTTGSEDRKAD